MYEDEFGPIHTIRILVGGTSKVIIHHLHIALPVSLVGGSVKRVLNGFAKASIVFKVGVVDDQSALITGIVLCHVAAHGVGLVGTPPT